MVDMPNPLRVVMIDDDQDDIFLTKVICKRSSLPVEFKGLNSGKALYEYIKNNGIGSIDVILLDVNMPKEDGYEVLKRLRDYPYIEDLKIVMFSTSRRAHERDLALALGASEFLEKPSHATDAVKLVELLSAYHAETPPVMQVSAMQG